MTRLDELISRARTIAVAGHTNPDGDCVGSCLAVWNYIREWEPGKKVTVYLESPPAKFRYLSGFEDICTVPPENAGTDLCVCLDSADRERLGMFACCLDGAARSVCVDHHVTNPGYAMENIIDAGAGSTCELLYLQMEESRVSRTVAECLYTGIVHDSGVFKYSSTTERTMTVAGKLMSTGIDFGGIIDDSFYKKTYRQSRIMGRALLDSVVFLDGKCVYSVVEKKDMDLYGADKRDLDGIVEQLRLIDGVECAIFLYAVGERSYKVSLRSKNTVDVSRIAASFGGGGHVRAAGCTMSGSARDVIRILSHRIEEQMTGVSADCPAGGPADVSGGPG